MSRRNVLFSIWLVTLSSCCCCAERGNHAIRRCWFDYNSLRCPALFVEQYDHLPYPQAQVGYYRWMYDKDPGHQLAALGPFPTPVCKPCNCPELPDDDEPFGYQALYPTGVPRSAEHLWSAKLPEPINVPRGPSPVAVPGASGSPPNGPAFSTEPIPMVPVPGATGAPGASPGLSNPQQRPVSPQDPTRRPADDWGPLPSFPPPPPDLPPKPADDYSPPAFGPSAPQDPNVRLTTGQATRSNPLAGPGSVSRQ